LFHAPQLNSGGPTSFLGGQSRLDFLGYQQLERATDLVIQFAFPLTLLRQISPQGREM
jgi:hypothetical protein